jgi:hypothetical protein
MTDRNMAGWFYMRSGFETFLLQPERHARYVFGERDRRQRDRLLESLEEASYSRDGYKAAIYGDYGRGKTHQCHNLIFEIKRRGLPFVPIYVKCSAFKKKEMFTALFRQLLFGHAPEEIQAVATEYARRVNASQASPLTDLIHSADIVNVITRGLTAPNPEAVKISMRWLAGEPKIDLTMLGGSLKPQLVDSGDYGDVMRCIAQMYLEVRQEVPLYIVDEAERLQNVTDNDSYFAWLAALRELTEIHNVALLLMVGAHTRDQLPTILVQEEIVRRIGVANYMEFVNPGRDDLKTFLIEQFQTSIRKGSVPDSQREVMDAIALDEAVPAGLRDATGGNAQRLESFPFEPEALDDFVAQVATGEMANKPSEAQLRLQKAAQRTMRLGRRTIERDVVDSLATDEI